jgi:UDP-N-acetylmuramoylalanine--D-glutamate ligase
MDAQDYFRGKRITVMGLGLLGGIGDIRYLAEQGAELTLTDLKSPEDLGSSLGVLKEFPNIRYTLGSHDLADFRDRDLIIKAPSTPIDSPYIAEAKRNGIPVTMWAALFCRFARSKGACIVGVTGTRGKTTTTAIIADILTKAGKQVIAGGNLAHTAMLPHLAELTSDTIIVLELDSWKLQGFAEEHLSPNIAVFTTFFPDHQNYYHSLDTYLADKAHIFSFQTPDDTFVLGQQCAELVRERHGDAMHARVIVADSSDLPEDWKLRMPGEHNRYDAALALVAVRTLGVADEMSRAALESFSGVPGRLELVATRNGIAFYNDTTATTPDATLAALRAVKGEGKRVHLIMGGADKELDMSELLAALPAHTTSIHMLAGTGTDLIAPALPMASVYTNLHDAFTAAVQKAEEGDAVLLSPAFASFGMFKNEYDRGDQFVALVNTYGM